MTKTGFSSSEQANMVAAEMQLSVVEKHGDLAQQGLRLLLGVMLTAMVWANFAQSDICAEATGEIEPRTRVQQIRPSTDGTILEYKISEGQAVKQGQTLVLLNTIRAEAELKKKERELDTLQTQLQEHIDAKSGLKEILDSPHSKPIYSFSLPEVDRIAGELYAAQKAFDSAKYDAFETSSRKGDSPEMEVLETQKQHLESARKAKKNSLQERKFARDAEIEMRRSQVHFLEQSLKNARGAKADMEAGMVDAKKEMEVYERGKQLGVASEVKYLDVQNAFHQREFSLAQQNQQIARLELQLKSAKLDLHASAKAYNADQADIVSGIKAEDSRIAGVPLSISRTMKELDSTQVRLNVAVYNARSRLSKEIAEISTLERKKTEIRAAVEVLRQELEEKRIVSPIDGTVSNLKHLMPGQLVERSQSLMTIVPSDKSLVLRATINNTDVGFLEVGQEARLRIEAFPCEEFGIIKGTVVRIGEFPEQRSENQKVLSEYKVTILPSATSIVHQGKVFELKPGLIAHADMVIRKRSVLGLLFEPLEKISN